ncbi:MAG: LCP family protein [Nocardioidaceae bacterium]
MGFDPSRTGGVWGRLLIGAAVVIFATAAATAVAAFREVDRVVSAFNANPELKLGAELAQTDPGEPQTIMLLGSDKRPRRNREGAGTDARSDTIILVRLDPSKRAVSLMSLPRDLRVTVPGHGVDRLNSAYEHGGPKLALRTVKRLTGLSVNHVINVDFRGFWAAVNAIGCVYADIDRRYYNASAEFSYIDIQPGYQKVCGRHALQYVRYRHEDNDLVRSARQQEFLREAKQQVGVRQLINDRDRLVRIFGRYTTSDIRSRAEVLRLLKLAVFSATQPVREVHFTGEITLGDEATNTPSYVTASNAQIKRYTRQFLGADEKKARPGVALAKRRHRRRAGGAVPGLERADGSGRDQAQQAARQGAGGRLRVLYPTLLTSGALYAAAPRVYKIKGPHGRRYGAYRMVVRRGILGEYYGLQGTTWRDPPILDDPTETRRVGGRTFELHYDGNRLRLVAWRTPTAAYWVSNTLLETVSARQMIAIARSTRPL